MPLSPSRLPSLPSLSVVPSVFSVLHPRPLPFPLSPPALSPLYSYLHPPFRTAPFPIHTPPSSPCFLQSWGLIQFLNPCVLIPPSSGCPSPPRQRPESLRGALCPASGSRCPRCLCGVRHQEGFQEGGQGREEEGRQGEAHARVAQGRAGKVHKGCREGRRGKDAHRHGGLEAENGTGMSGPPPPPCLYPFPLPCANRFSSALSPCTTASKRQSMPSKSRT